ncbi:GldM family protein [Sanyastnella coralliicola]|uniref:GldM family protein n=1 Tax=Sanyastnella coralliicola TaxID=3069118 RepID=UPI0027B94806|nr:GldM family protein [Longitalea sp. SCSIO 12813]
MRALFTVIFFFLIIGVCGQKPVVSNPMMNLIYRHVENPISIAMPGYDCEQLRVKCEGALFDGKGCDYTILAQEGNQAILTISAVVNGDTLAQDEYYFRVKSVPDPVPSFAGKKPNDHTISKPDLMVAAGIRAEMQNFDYIINTKVVAFDMVVMSPEGGYIVKSSTSNRLTAEMKALLKKTKRGEVVRFINIVALMPGGEKREVANLGLKVV